MSDVDLIINVHTNGVKDITNLSAATKALALNLRGITVPMAKLDTQSKALNKALGMTSKSMNDHATSIKELVSNQKALSTESKRVQSNISSYRTAIAAAGGSNTEFGRELMQNQRQLIGFGTTLRGLKIRAFGSDLQSISLKMQRIGKDAQFVGRSLMMNLTMPIMAFARLGFQNLVKVDEQLVRLSKILEGVAMNAAQADLKLGKGLAGPARQAEIKRMVDSFRQLESGLTNLSNKFGVSKDLVVGLATDFAELGITANDNITALTEMTLAAEKLGNMDASGAQDLTQALYFNSRRALEASGAMDNLATAAQRESRAIAAAKTQLYMFNTIENVTALSLKDLAQALPEVGSMAVSFGLSMTEAAAMLAPMKAAGLDVGASANSIKISLQRVISPTNKTTKLLERLAKQYGVSNDAQSAFNNTTKTGLAGLEAITEVFDKVANSSAGSEGALKLMSQIFEKRQGPRMLIAIEQLNNFNKELRGVNATARSQSSEGLMAITAEKALVKYNQLNRTALPTTVKNFRDIGIIARIATATTGQMVEGFKGTGGLGAISQKDIETAKAVRGEVGKLVLDKKQLEGIDLIGQAKSESGRAMLVELAGASNAQDVANMELEQSLSALGVTVQKIKNTFKNFASEMLKTVRPAVESIQKKLAELYKSWQGLSDATREKIAKFVVGFMALLAALGPVVLALGTMQASVGVIGRGISFFIPKLKGFEGGLVGIAKGAKLAATGLNDVYKNFLSKKLSKSILPSIASGAGSPSQMIGIPQRIGRNVMLPGNVAPTPTSLVGLAGPARTAAVASNRAARSAHAAAGTASVNQYMRNETQMLGSRGMRLNAAGRVINTRGGFVAGSRGILEDVSKASVLREAKFAESGISRTMAGGTRLATKSGLVDISERQAQKISRGGITGKIARTQVGARESISSIGQAPQKAMQAYRKSIGGARDAIKQMHIEQMALGGSAGKIKTLATAMRGFMEQTNLGTIALKIMKSTLLASGIGIVLLAVGVAVMLIVKNFDQFKKAGASAFTGLKNAWGIFKNALLELTRPIQDLFSHFSKGGKDGKSAVGGLAVIFGGLVKVLQFVAKAFKGFVNLIKPYLYMIVNIVGAVVALFQGHFGSAFKFIVAAFAQAAIFLINIGKAVVKGLLSVFFLFVKGVVSYFTFIPKAWAKAIGWLAKHAGPFKGLLNGISDGINGVVDTMFGLVDTAHNAVNKAVDAAGNLLTKGLKKGADLGIKESTNSLSGSGKTKIVDAAKDTGEAAGEAIASGTGDGYDKADPTGAIAKKLTDGIKEAVQQLQDYVSGELKNAIEKYVDSSTKALEKQKASALKVFDVQLKTLTKLEKAEESLTKKKEYEVNRRKLIDDKTLSDETFRRNYALAVYEGRIDDSRALQQQQKADQRNLSNDLLAIDDARSKDLAKENLDALTTAINEAKDAASTFFDEAIVKFQESVTEITKFPPITIEDYKKQIEQLYTITNDTADKNGAAFQKMFEDFATTINTKMPNSVVGAFSTNLDDLVQVAKDKYGLGATPGEDTIIGATIGMLVDIGGKFGEGKQAVIDKFGEVTTGFKDNFKTASTAIVKSVTDDFLKPFEEATTKFKTNWEEVYVKAIKDGNQAITDSLRNNTTVNKALFDEMQSKLDETSLKWLKLKAAADAAADAQSNAANGGGGGGGGDTTPPSTTVTTGLNIGRADPFVANNALLVKAGKTPISYTQFTQGKGLTTAAIKGTPSATQLMPKNGTPPRHLKKGGIVSRAFGGTIPGRSGNQNNGYPDGYIPAPTQEGVPALLHGGEYIINAKAVNRIGVGALNKLNNNLIPRFLKGGQVPKKSGSIAPKKGDGALNGPYGTVVKPVVPGNINLRTLPAVKNNIPGEGGVSTVRSLSVGIDRGVMLLPTVVNGKIISDQQAIKFAMNSGKNLGVYKDDATAEMAAQLIHLSEANRVGRTNPSNIKGSVDRIEPKRSASSKFPTADTVDRYLQQVKRQQQMSTPLGAIRLAQQDAGYVEPKYDWTNMTKFGMGGLTIGAEMLGTYFGGPVGGALATAVAYNLTNRLGNYLAGTGAAPGFKGDTSLKGSAMMGGFSLGGALVGSALGKGLGAVSGLIGRKSVNEAAQLSLQETIQSAVPKPSMALELYRGPLQAQTITREAFKDADRLITESFEMYKIGTENVGFGIPRNTGGWDTALNFKNVDLNPYDISGMSEFSNSGQEIAKKWAMAHAGYKAGTDAGKSNLIDALLYSGSRGDINSMLRFNQFAQQGLDAVNVTKSNSGLYKTSLEELQRSVQRGGLDSLNLDDLFLVHETAFKPPVDKFGNISLKPTGDYQSIFNDQFGRTEYTRDSIHMAVNHLVSGHAQRESLNAGHIIVSKFKDVLEANPGALDNLYAVDTWFTPKPGEGLTIPKGSFETFTGGAKPAQQVQDAMQSLLGVDRISGKYLFQGGSHGSETEGADALLRIFGKDLNVGFGTHFDTPAYRLSQIDNIRSANSTVSDVFNINNLSRLSDNAISRIAARRNLLTGVSRNTNWLNPSPMKTGGYVPGAPSSPFPAILHGGEYVVNADAVRNMGVRTMQSINQSRFTAPSGAPAYSGGGQTTSVSTLNINVDTFIGEEEWFKGMMKDYNINVLPKQQKAAGLESRTFTSYNGIQGF